jgi:hypothetical protein
MLAIRARIYNGIKSFFIKRFLEFKFQWMMSEILSPNVGIKRNPGEPGFLNSPKLPP